MDRECQVALHCGIESKVQSGIGLKTKYGSRIFTATRLPGRMSDRAKSSKHRSVFGESHYCVTGVHSQAPWDPDTCIRGISSYPPASDINLDYFLYNCDEILTLISDTAVGERQPEYVPFLLHTVFPYLDTTIAKRGRTKDILSIILKLSCVKQCPVVTRYALHMILDTLTKTSYDSGGMFSEFLLECESSLRGSVLDMTIFNYENAEDQGLRIFVYSRSLVMLYANIVQGTIPQGNMNNDFSALLVRLGELEKQLFFVEEDKPRYAIRFIKTTVEKLIQFQSGKKMKKSFYTFLKWLREYNSKGEENKAERNESVENFLSKIKKAPNGWFDFHAAIFCLGSQIHKKPQNREILWALVECYVKQHSSHLNLLGAWSGEREWETGLVLGNVIEDIVMEHHDRGTRTLACQCLIYCFEMAKRKSPARIWLQKSLNRCLYGPNKDLREVILKHMKMAEKRKEKDDDDVIGEDLGENLPITQSMEYLVQRYKKQLLPSSVNSSKVNDLQGHFLATFRDERAFIKILLSTKGDFIRELRAEGRVLSKIHQQLIMEAYTLRRLNLNPHPNILQVFAYDTSAQPYHLITELVSEGSLLHYLRTLRTRPEHMPVPSALLKMMFGILDALIYLDEQHLVHLALMAANVLVSHDNVCKLTGFQYVRQMIEKVGGRTFAYVSRDDEMPLRHAAPECLENGYFSEHCVCWAVGIMLFETHTFGVSPYNRYSNEQADQIRSHVIGRGELKMEDCIRSEVLEEIRMCVAYEKEERPSLAELKKQLEQIHDNIIQEEKDCPAVENYPDLTHVDIAMTRDTLMISSSALEEIDKEKNLGNFGSDKTSTDRPTIRIFNGKQVIREIVLKKTEENLHKLKNLKHENVVKVILVSDHDMQHVALVTEYSGLGNLLQEALAKTYTAEALVTFAAQTAQGMEYLHKNNVIHGHLIAEHIMVFPNNQIKVSRLGRSKSREMLHSSCDAGRWSPPELIKHGNYSRSSDVYSYGLMWYELFEALDKEKVTTEDNDNQIQEHLESKNRTRPDKPKLMPIWVNIILRQCFLDEPAARPTFAVIVDTLTSRRPFDSYLLSHLMSRKLIQVEIVDIHVTQPDEASHVIPKEHHKNFEELRKIVYDEIQDADNDYEEIPVRSISKNTAEQFPSRPPPLQPIQVTDPGPPLKPYPPIKPRTKIPNEAESKSRPQLSLPVSQKRNHPSVKEDSIRSSSSNDEPSGRSLCMVREKHFPVDQHENQGQRYVTMTCNDPGASERHLHSN